MIFLSSLWQIKDNIGRADVIVSFGIGVRKNGEASSLSKAVAMKATELYKQGFAPKILFTGGFSQNGVTEAEAMQKVAIKEGGLAKDIILETDSKNTYINVKNSLKIIKRMKATRILIVAQAIHARRVRATFKKCMPDNYTLYWSSAKSDYDIVPNQKRLRSEDRFLLWEIYRINQFRLNGWA